MPNVTFKPSWGTFEKDLHSNNLDTAEKATEAFTTEREKELKTSAAARAWEKDRKAQAAKEKPQWVKEKREKERAPFIQAVNELKRGGKFDTGLKKIMPGFALIKPIVETETNSGILLQNELGVNTNTGEVIQVGGKIVHLHEVVEPPVEPGDKVMFKKGLPGLEMTIKGEFHLLMMWGDILAVIGDKE